jgi:predicted nucleic acid-binding protein
VVDEFRVKPHHRDTEVAQRKAKWKTFEQFDDKGWGFTACMSKVVMEQLGSFREDV